MAKSAQKRTEGTNRVTMSLDLLDQGGLKKRELPFVLGVLGDLSGNAPGKEKKSKIANREFVDIDKDNFNDVIDSVRPGVSMRVPNVLDEDSDSEIAVNLEFSSMSDFEPAAIARQVEPLREILDARQQLIELLSRLDGNDELEEALEKTLRDNDKLAKLAAELGIGSAGGAAGADQDEEANNG